MKRFESGSITTRRSILSNHDDVTIMTIDVLHDIGYQVDDTKAENSVAAKRIHSKQREEDMDDDVDKILHFHRQNNESHNNDDK
jgi:predicted hydrolase (HD superfamily)